MAIVLTVRCSNADIEGACVGMTPQAPVPVQSEVAPPWGPWSPALPPHGDELSAGPFAAAADSPTPAAFGAIDEEAAWKCIDPQLGMALAAIPCSGKASKSSQEKIARVRRSMGRSIGRGKDFRLLSWSRRRRAAETRRYLELLEAERVVPGTVAIPDVPVTAELAALGALAAAR